MHPNCNPFISQPILWLCADTHIEAQLTSIFPNITQGQAANLICHSQHTDQTATDTSFVVQSQQGVCTGIPYKADESLPDEMLVKMNNIPDSKVHGANMLAPWTLLSGMLNIAGGFCFMIFLPTKNSNLLELSLTLICIVTSCPFY